MLVVLFMRQTVVRVAWWQVVPVAGAASLVLPVGYPFAGYFTRYLIFGVLGTALMLRLVPPALASGLPEVLFRVGLLRRTPRERK